MKNLITILLLFISNFVFSQPIDQVFERANGAVNILGKASLERLQADPFKEWYDKNYEDYEVDRETLSSLKMPDSITLFMGTWCGDSKREVPRFIKALEAVSFDFEKLNIICLNTGFQNYKQAPEREEAGQNIHRVPTFIFHSESGEEIGRIVEEPVVSLEKDLKDIIEGKPYETFYPVAHGLIEKMKKTSVKELRKGKSNLVDEYNGKAVSEYELNTFGYVLWASFRLIEAEFVFELNTLLFPESTVPLRTLASFKSNLGKEKEAISIVKKGLKIDPENESLLDMKAALETD